jgi:hypothetical protein
MTNGAGAGADSVIEVDASSRALFGDLAEGSDARGATTNADCGSGDVVQHLAGGEAVASE